MHILHINFFHIIHITTCHIVLITQKPDMITQIIHIRSFILFSWFTSFTSQLARAFTSCTARHISCISHTQFMCYITHPSHRRLCIDHITHHPYRLHHPHHSHHSHVTSDLTTSLFTTPFTSRSACHHMTNHSHPTSHAIRISHLASFTLVTQQIPSDISVCILRALGHFGDPFMASTAFGDVGVWLSLNSVWSVTFRGTRMRWWCWSGIVPGDRNIVWNAGRWLEFGNWFF